MNTATHTEEERCYEKLYVIDLSKCPISSITGNGANTRDYSMLDDESFSSFYSDDIRGQKEYMEDNPWRHYDASVAGAF